jgi:hypothetical protein
LHWSKMLWDSSCWPPHRGRSSEPRAILLKVCYLAAPPSWNIVLERGGEATPCSFGLSATSQRYFSLKTNQSLATSQQYFSLRTNQHQPSATSQTNGAQLKSSFEWLMQHEVRRTMFLWPCMQIMQPLHLSDLDTGVWYHYGQCVHPHRCFTDSGNSAVIFG